jgi:hypothetical protein
MAPVQIASEKVVLAIRLVKNIGDDNRFYIHEVLDLPGEKNKDNTLQTLGTDLTARPQGGIALYKNILHEILSVKEE